MTPRRAYRTDLSDARWALIEPILTEWRQRRRGLPITRVKHPLREIVNAILYVNRTGIAWEYLPHDFPPAKTVYDYYAKWEADGTTERIHDALRERVRTDAGHDPAPSAAIIDSQSVKTSANVADAEQGFDPAKRIKGRKRHIAVDVLGLLLVVIVTAAGVQDSAAGRSVLDALAPAHPAVTKVWVDGGYNTGVVTHGQEWDIDVEVVRRDPDTIGFTVLPRRWCVERTLGWLMNHRRLARDYEALPQRSRSMMFWAMINIMSRRVTNESTPSWRT